MDSCPLLRDVVVGIVGRLADGQRFYIGNPSAIRSRCAGRTHPVWQFQQSCPPARDGRRPKRSKERVVKLIEHGPVSKPE